jgi:hypothetical protein
VAVALLSDAQLLSRVVGLRDQTKRAVLGVLEAAEIATVWHAEQVQESAA